MLSLGTEVFFAFWMASNNVGLPTGSPPPVRAATSMFLTNLAKALPRRASTTAFLCLVVAHLEWPLMRCAHLPLVGAASDALQIQLPDPSRQVGGYPRVISCSPAQSGQKAHELDARQSHRGETTSPTQHPDGRRQPGRGRQDRHRHPAERSPTRSRPHRPAPPMAHG